MFSFPESCGATNKGLHISNANLREAGEVSGVLEAQINWLDEVFLKQCEQTFQVQKLLIPKMQRCILLPQTENSYTANLEKDKQKSMHIKSCIIVLYK